MDQEPVPDTGAGSRAVTGAGAGAVTGAGAAEGARVVLHARPGCHLCDVAREAVARVCAEESVSWAEVDVDAAGAEELRARWTDLVPVVTVDGRLHEHWRIDPDRLRAAVTGAP